MLSAVFRALVPSGAVFRALVPSASIGARTFCVTALVACCLTACKKDEEPKFPPVIGEATITCDSGGQDAPLLATVGVEITDADGDLLPGSLEVMLNGVKIDGFADDDVDDIYTWSPPASWDPPAVCHGIFQLIVRVRDAHGHDVTETIEVDKS